MAFAPFPWIAETAAEFSWVIVPPVQNPSVWKSMSNACGLTAEPPLLGTAEMSTLIPPVPGYKHPVPLEFRAACSWYCQRVATGGCQHAPTEVLHGTGAAHPAVEQLACAGLAERTTGTTLSTVIVEMPHTIAGALRSLMSRSPLDAGEMSARHGLWAHEICALSIR